MKKFGVFVFASLLLLSVFVSAQGSIASNLFSGSSSGSVASFVESFVDGAEPIVKLLVGSTGGESNLDSSFLFAKFLLLILVVAVIWVPVKTMPFVGGERNGLAFVISLIVGLLSIRFLSSELISTILLPYTALGISITAFLPLVLYFVWVEKGLEGAMYTTIRKAAWIFALVVFVALYFVRLPLLNPSAFASVYLIAGALCLIMFFADQTIQNAFNSAKLNSRNALNLAEHTRILDDKYIAITKNRFNSGFESKNANIEITDLQKKAKGANVKDYKKRYALLKE